MVDEALFFFALKVVHRATVNGFQDGGRVKTHENISKRYATRVIKIDNEGGLLIRK